MSVVPFSTLYTYSFLFLALVFIFLLAAAALGGLLSHNPRSRVPLALLLGYEVTFVKFVEMTLKLFHCRSIDEDGAFALLSFLLPGTGAEHKQMLVFCFVYRRHQMGAGCRH